MNNELCVWHETGIQFAVYEFMKRILLHQPPPKEQKLSEKDF
jgi:hypothetical protein